MERITAKCAGARTGHSIHDKDIISRPLRNGTTSNVPSEDTIDFGIVSPRLSSRIRGLRDLVSSGSEIL